jgi:hypothetical protein
MIIDIPKYTSLLTEQRRFLHSELEELAKAGIISEGHFSYINKEMVKMLVQKFPDLIPIAYNSLDSE